MLQCWYQYCQSIGLLCGVTRTSTAACHTPISRGGFLCPHRLAAAGKLYADQTVLVDHLLSFLSAGHRRGFREGRRPVTTVSDGVEVPRDGGGERSHGEIMGRGPRWTSDHSSIPWAPTAVHRWYGCRSRERLLWSHLPRGDSGSTGVVPRWLGWGRSRARPLHRGLAHR
jgi:hypothetical protein